MTHLLETQTSSQEPANHHHETREFEYNQTPLILCVDDDPDLQTSIEVQLRKYQVRMETAFFGMQGIAEAIHSIPDLMIVDLAMPNGNGEYFIECVKANVATSGIPIIVLTGMRNPILKRRVLNAGCDVFLQKPVEFDDLLHHMSRFIDVRKQTP